MPLIKLNHEMNQMIKIILRRAEEEMKLILFYLFIY